MAQSFQWRIQDFPDGGRGNPDSGAKTYYLASFFAENCMKMKKCAGGGDAANVGALWR